LLHKKRRWCVAPVASPEDLAEKLTEHTWTGCTAFELSGYVFCNDATSADGAQEYAVLKPLDGDRFDQVESITFSWCTRERALELVRQVLAGTFDAERAFGEVEAKLEAPAEHGTCPLCA